MFRKYYKEANDDIKPDEAFVNSVIKKAKRRKIHGNKAYIRYAAPLAAAVVVVSSAVISMPVWKSVTDRSDDIIIEERVIETRIPSGGVQDDESHPRENAAEANGAQDDNDGKSLSPDKNRPPTASPKTGGSRSGAGEAVSGSSVSDSASSAKRSGASSNAESAQRNASAGSGNTVQRNASAGLGSSAQRNASAGSDNTVQRSTSADNGAGSGNTSAQSHGAGQESTVSAPANQGQTSPSSMREGASGQGNTPYAPDAETGPSAPDSADKGAQSVFSDVTRSSMPKIAASSENKDAAGGSAAENKKTGGADTSSGDFVQETVIEADQPEGRGQGSGSDQTKTVQAKKAARSEDSGSGAAAGEAAAELPYSDSSYRVGSAQSYSTADDTSVTADMTESKAKIFQTDDADGDSEVSEKVSDESDMMLMEANEDSDYSDIQSPSGYYCVSASPSGYTFASDDGAVITVRIGYGGEDSAPSYSVDGDDIYVSFVSNGMRVSIHGTGADRSSIEEIVDGLR